MRILPPLLKGSLNLMDENLVVKGSDDSLNECSFSGLIILSQDAWIFTVGCIL